ncbi:12-oxophytodienoate reductase 7 isoform X2 [Physcomitrium patens]|nr:12-oxophytodienoate reductase 7-like isoform X2 [Physcomitrium patens]|eukprot:XP_024357192.1 12-oxophytodienoate reductase 7-like isoform X2 [Physcomitrella patens]
MTRCRAIGGVPQESLVKHYAQRASLGGLLISEANAVSPEAYGFSHSPGIFMTEQVRAWKKVTGAVHAKGAYIFCRIWHVGRASHYIHQPNWQKPLSSTGKAIQPPFLVRLSEGEMARFSDPRALAAHEIPLIVQQFQHAAKNGIAAGFDGVELHAAHGYLVDQFLKDGINDRTDEYGSSVENRCQFLLEFVAAIVENVIIINMIN